MRQATFRDFDQLAANSMPLASGDTDNAEEGLSG